jgi:GTPase SAR1 family protein
MKNFRSFENLENYWLKEIKNHAPQNAVLLLVGNKADMEAERKVDFDRAERYFYFVAIFLNEVDLFRLAKRIGVSL